MVQVEADDIHPHVTIRRNQKLDLKKTYITEPANVYQMSVTLGQQILADIFIFLLVWPEVYLIYLDISLAIDI